MNNLQIIDSFFSDVVDFVIDLLYNKTEFENHRDERMTDYEKTRTAL